MKLIFCIVSNLIKLAHSCLDHCWFHESSINFFRFLVISPMLFSSCFFSLLMRASQDCNKLTIKWDEWARKPSYRTNRTAGVRVLVNRITRCSAIGHYSSVRIIAIDDFEDFHLNSPAIGNILWVLEMKTRRNSFNLQCRTLIFSFRPSGSAWKKINQNPRTWKYRLASQIARSDFSNHQSQTAFSIINK